MKPQKQNVIMAALILLLGASLLLNYLQGNQVSQLMEEVKNMEYIQAVLSSQIDNIEERGKSENESPQ